MDRTISTKDLKSKLDEKGIRVVETLGARLEIEV
jgi:hypothetical protein